MQRPCLSAAIRHLKQFRPDFIYERYSLNDLTGAELRRRFGVPLVLEYNGSEVWAQRHWGKPLRFERLAEQIELENLGQADLIVVVSEEIKKQVLAAGIPDAKVLFYPNCVDSRLFNPARFDEQSRLETRQDLGISADSDLFTFVGTFGLWHGTEVLAGAIRQLLETSREWIEKRRLHFLFVGDGQRAGKVRSILGPYEGKPFVTFVGLRPQGETPRLLAASDVVISPHVRNPDGTPFLGSPTKLFEYMAMGKLIIASDLDQIGSLLRGIRPEALQQQPEDADPLGLLVQPGDVSDLVRAIRQAAEMDHSVRQQFAAKAHRFVMGNYMWNHNVVAVTDALQRLSNRRLGGLKPGVGTEPGVSRMRGVG